MSLILDALRKLEREKQGRDPGVVVVGTVPWRGRDASRRATLAIVGALGLLVVGTAVVLMWVARPDAGPASNRSEALPAAADRTPAPAALSAIPEGASTARPTPSPDRGATGPEPPPPRERSLPGPEAPPSTGAAEPGAALPASDSAATDPAAAPPSARPRLLLTAISERDGRPVAVLNDRLVHEGDSVDGARVLRIGATEVEVEIDGQREVIRF